VTGPAPIPTLLSATAATDDVSQSFVHGWLSTRGLRNLH
jgi:hypothetical protein